MTSSIFTKYFNVTFFAMYCIAALPKKVYLKTPMKTYLFNNVWPKVFLMLWCPLVPMVTLKIIQYASKKEWEECLNTTHMYVYGCNCLYMTFATHKTSRLFKKCLEGIEQHFKVWHQLNSSDMQVVFVLYIIFVSCYLFLVGGTIYYGEVMVPLWVPFIDNDQEYSLVVFFGIWFYEGMAGLLIFVIYGFVSPFPVVMTSVIVNELGYLIQKVDSVKFNLTTNIQPLPLNNILLIENDDLKSSPQWDTKHSLIHDDKNELLHVTCTSENHTKTFIAELVEHHKAIWRVTKEVSKIYHNVLLTQMLFTICHSCLLAFTMYYTERLTKIVFKSSPILMFSYYSLFMHCWNGDRLTEAYDHLFRALYRCPWYDAPHSFKTSLNIMMTFCKRPVGLAGGGIFKASLHSFSKGVQQSITYILFLKQLTPDN